jgi:hypothetical protein
MHDQDWDFDVVVPADDPIRAPRIWMYAGSDAIGVLTLESIVRHVRAGGTLVVASQLPDRAHSGGALATERVRQLVADLRASDRVVLARPAELGRVLTQLGTTRYSVAGVPGCRTYNYVSEGERDLWVVNSTEEHYDVTVALNCPIDSMQLEELTEHQVLELSSTAPPRSEGSVLVVTMPPKTVRAFRFPYDDS